MRQLLVELIVVLSVLLGIILLVGCGDVQFIDEADKVVQSEGLPEKMEFDCEIDRATFVPQIECSNEVYDCHGIVSQQKLVCEVKDESI